MAYWGVLWAWTSEFESCSSAELEFGPRLCEEPLEKGLLSWSGFFIYCVGFFLPATKISPSFPDTHLFPCLKLTCLKAALLPVLIAAGSHECGMNSLPQAQGLWITFPWLLLNLPVMFGELVWAFCPDLCLYPCAWPYKILQKCEAVEDVRSQMCLQGQERRSRTSSKF